MKAVFKTMDYKINYMCRYLKAIYENRRQMNCTNVHYQRGYS